MDMDKSVSFLLDNAGPSIVYRTKKEITGDISLRDEQALQEKILQGKDVKYIFEHVQPDGWLGTCFHSGMRGAKWQDVCEAALRFLTEKGVKLDNPVFEGAMKAYLTRDRMDPIFDGCGKEEDYRYPCIGFEFLRSAGIARCGYEGRIDISKDIDYSLNCFFNVLNFNSIDEVVYPDKCGKYCFKKELSLWPCIYNLRILAFTRSWRMTGNIKKLADAVDHLLSFPAFDHPVYTKVNGYPKSPFGGFIRPIEGFDPGNVKGTWFDRMELFARCGIIPYSKCLLREVDLLKKAIDTEGICRAFIDEPFFAKWGAYSGLKLEENWSSETKKRCDITFRALLILSYAERMGT
jgi:hypothetical protein